MANGTKINGTRPRMPALQRWLVYALAGGLWITGCVWLVLHLFFETPTEFGAGQHPWEPPLLLVHGLIAVPALYLLGWISARHALDGWRMGRRRPSGGAMLGVLGVLAVSGFGLFFATGDLVRTTIAFAHEVVGVACVIVIVVHTRVREVVNAPEADAAMVESQQKLASGRS